MGARVLVVDDDPWILRMVKATLEKRDYSVDTAREGRQALARAQSSPPDVIITDIMMPVMDGWTFVKELRSIPRLSEIPVVFLTALGKEDARLKKFGLTSDDYLPKPFRFDDLEKRIETALTKVAPAPAPEEPPPSPAPEPDGFGASDPGTGGGQAQAPQYATPPPQYGQAPYPSPPPQAPPPQAPPPQAPPQPPYGQPYQGYPPAAYPPQYPPYPPYPGYPPPGQGTYPGYPYGPPAPMPATGQPPDSGHPQPQPPPQAPMHTPVPEMPRLESDAPVEPVAPPQPQPPSSGQFPRRSTALNGRLEQLGLSSLLVMMEMERKDGVLTLKPADSETVGRIFLRGGQVIHAKLQNQESVSGRESVYEMLTWRKGTFSFNAMEVDMEDTVQSSTTHLLMEGARLIDESNRDGGL